MQDTGVAKVTVVYPKDKMLKIAELIKSSHTELTSQSGFDTVEAMFEDMGITTKS